MTHPLARLWWLVLLAAGAAGIGAFFTASAQPVQYDADVRLLVGGLESDFDAIRAAEALATTYAELATSDVLLGRAADAAEVDLLPSSLRDRVSAVTVGTSRIVLVTVRMPTQDSAVELASAVGSTLVGYDAAVTPNLEIIDGAAPGRRVSQRVPLFTALGAIGGAALVGAIILLLPPIIRDEPLVRRQLQ